MKYKTALRCIIMLGLLLTLAAGKAQTAAASPAEQSSAEGEALFKEKCAACHTIGGGRLAGPDLQGVTEQREAAWLKTFILNPETLFNQKDALALQLLDQYNGLRMPNLGLTGRQADSVLLFLASASPGISNPPPAALPPGNALAGQKLFTGETRFANGGAACSACHQGVGLGFLDGGSLGPDLRHVFTRYGEAGLASSLSPVAFPSMQGSFQNQPLTGQELADLIEYFRWSDQQAAAAPQNAGLLMLGIGSGGALLLFGLLALFWRGQRQSLAQQLRSRRRPGR